MLGRSIQQLFENFLSPIKTMLANQRQNVSVSGVVRVSVGKVNLVPQFLMFRPRPPRLVKDPLSA